MGREEANGTPEDGFYLPIRHADEIVGRTFIGGDRKTKPVHKRRLVATLSQWFRPAAIVRHVGFRRRRCHRRVAVTSVHADRHVLVRDVCVNKTPTRTD